MDECCDESIEMECNASGRRRDERWRFEIDGSPIVDFNERGVSKVGSGRYLPSARWKSWNPASGHIPTAFLNSVGQ